MPGTSEQQRALPGSDLDGASSLIVQTAGEHVLRVTLNRPERMNAVDRPMRAGLIALWASVKERRDIRCIIVTGAGERAFTVGMDLKNLVADGGFPEVPEKLTDHLGISPLRQELWTPLVVAVNGVCTGVGLQLLADADVVLASSTASFLDSHVSVGQVSALESIALVPRIGLGQTLKLCLLGTNGRIGADEALRIGMVDEVVPPERLADRALEIAEQICLASPNAVRLTKQAIRQSMQLPQAEAEQSGWELLRSHREHPDAMEGPRAFVERRPPSWSDAW